MDQKEISRRETLSLAKFGLLLAAGLGVVETDKATQIKGGTQFKLDTEVGGFSVKLFKFDGANFTLLKTMNLPAVQAKQVLADQTSQVTIKFWRPAGRRKQAAVDGGSISGSMFKTI